METNDLMHKRGRGGLRKARCVLRCRKNGGKLKGCRRKCHVKGKHHRRRRRC